MFEVIAQTPAPPAGGAEVGQILIASIGAAVITAALLYLGFGHRSGRVKLLEGWARRAERIAGIPGWAALPAGIATASLIIALFGMYWDISLHIDKGRDPGPLANPAHYFILAGLFGDLLRRLHRDRPARASGRRGPRCASAGTGRRRSAAS